MALVTFKGKDGRRVIINPEMICFAEPTDQRDGPVTYYRLDITLVRRDLQLRFGSDGERTDAMIKLGLMDEP